MPVISRERKLVSITCAFCRGSGKDPLALCRTFLRVAFVGKGNSRDFLTRIVDVPTAAAQELSRR